MCKLAEAIAFIALAALLYQSYRSSSGQSVAGLRIAAVVLLSLAFGAIGYGAGLASQPLFPSLGEMQMQGQAPISLQR